MNYLDGFRDPGAVPRLQAQLHDLGKTLAEQGRSLRLMEVCGSHTMAIARYGIRELLPANVRLLSGPGCPVCVTETGYVDAAIALAQQGVMLATFGDMMRTPGSQSDLIRARANGGSVTICYSPMEALTLARNHPDQEVVFLAVGFETTIAPLVATLDQAVRGGVGNFSLLTACKLVPPALAALIADPELRVNGFLCPAHVSAIIGADAYRPVAEGAGIPCVVAGFEPLDILDGLVGLLTQAVRGQAWVDNRYARVVRPGGNPRALALMAHYLEPTDAAWRGLGMIPASGLGLRPAYARHDAARRFGLTIEEGQPHLLCRCGELLKGQIDPPECALFGTVCLPERPVGPCMVSAEGSCAAWYKYGGEA